MDIIDYIKKFCAENSDGYSVYETDKRFGIVVKSGFSHMEMLLKLTEYMGEVDLKEDELTFSEGMLIEEDGTDVVVVFSNVR